MERMKDKEEGECEGKENGKRTEGIILSQTVKERQKKWKEGDSEVIRREGVKGENKNDEFN